MNIDDIGKIGAQDQIKANLTDFASWVAHYHAELIRFGMPAELAEAIILDWHHLNIHKSLWPNDPPRGES